MTADAPLPRLAAALGDTLLEVRQRSTFAFRTDLLRDDALVATDQPLQFAVDGPGAFDLPPTRFASLEATAAVVTAIQTSPQRDYLALAPAQALVDTLRQRIDHAGWIADADGRPVPTPAELALALRDPALPDDTWWFVDIRRLGTARLYVKLRRAHRAGRTGAEALFLVTLQWRDDALLDRAVELAKDLRAEDGLDRQADRPIELEAYCRRVRARLPRTPA